LPITRRAPVLTILAAVLAGCGSIPESGHHPDASPRRAAELTIDTNMANLGDVEIGKVGMPPATFVIKNVGDDTSGTVHVTVTVMTSPSSPPAAPAGCL
jgi:hypothetical protein